nr:hypothetical protein [Elizabethkingia bruuniana]
MIKRITHLSVLVAPLFFYAQHTKTDTTSVGTIQEVSLQGTKSFRTKNPKLLQGSLWRTWRTQRFIVWYRRN